MSTGDSINKGKGVPRHLLENKISFTDYFEILIPITYQFLNRFKLQLPMILII